MQVVEKETLSSLEEMKNRYVQEAKVSCCRLMEHLQSGLLLEQSAMKEYNVLGFNLEKANQLNELIDVFLDYFVEHGKPDNGLTEQCIRALTGHIRNQTKDVIG